MARAAESRDFSDLIDDLDEAAADNGAKVSVEEILDTVGRRSFGPLLLLAGLLGMTPVAGIPSVPSIIAIMVLLVAGQMLIGRETIWLPKFLLRLSVKAEKLRGAAKIARKPAGFVDGLVRPRLAVMTGLLVERLVALVLVVVAAATPPLELLPFVAFFPSLAIVAFGLGLVARDGLMVLLSLLIALGIFGFAGWQLLT